MAGDRRVVASEGGRPAAVVHPERLARALRSPVRRLALAVVLERREPVPVGELVSAVVVGAESVGSASPSDDGAVRAALHHRHLPLLAHASLVERRESGYAFARGDHVVLDHPAVTPDSLRRESDAWAQLPAVFGRPRRRIAVRVLSRREPPVSRTDLARSVAAETVGELGPGAEYIEAVASRLHHVDLPLLEDAGVLTYDPDAGCVESVSKPELVPSRAGF